MRAMSDPRQRKLDYVLPTALPLIWPDPRVVEGLKSYQHRPPSRVSFADASLIGGLVVGYANEATNWLAELVKGDLKRRITLVLVVQPAGPTREWHLRAIEDLYAARKNEETSVEIRLLPVEALGDDTERRTSLPPTVILGVNEATGQTVMSVGSVGDAGCDDTVLGSLNLVFRPDDALRDAWRRWFQYIASSAVPLTEDTMKIPQLAPAKGDPEGALLWLDFMQACEGASGQATAKPTVDVATGEVVVGGDGQVIDPWDGGATALDPLAQRLQQVYGDGWLVTIDEGTRIKPLSVPVRATLLDEQGENTVGTVTQRQSFSLKVLDDRVDKAIEKCRKVTDLMDLLTFQLSQGNRWLPGPAKALLEKELAARNEAGKKVLQDALKGDVKSFIAGRQDAIRRDLNLMYQQLGRGNAVPNDKLQAILEDVHKRLSAALNARVTPRVMYNRIAPPDLSTKAPLENWNQPLSLLLQAARLFRASLTDSYFPRRFSSLAFGIDDFERACDVFGDTILVKPDPKRATGELQLLAELMESTQPAKSRSDTVWRMITGQSGEGPTERQP